MSSNAFAKPCNHLSLPMIPFGMSSSLGPLTAFAKASSAKVSSQTARPDSSQPEVKGGQPKVKLETDFVLNNERTKYLLETGFMSDVVFLVDNEETKQEERISCHKLILATRSRVFSTLFYGQNAEKSNEIKINDVKAKDFKNLLKYVYYDDTDVGIQSFVSTLVAAEKYAVRPLSKTLIDQIKHFDGDQTCIMLKQLESHRLTNKDLQRELAKKQQIETKMIIDSGEFLSLSMHTVKELLSNESLNVKEVQLFRAVLRWAKHQCLVHRLEINPINLKKTISRLAYLLRYASMSLEDFADGPGKLRILADSELVDLFLYFTLKVQPVDCLHKPLIFSKRLSIPVYEVSLCDKFFDENSRGLETVRAMSLPVGEFIDFKTDCEIFLRGLQSSVEMGEKQKKLSLHKKSGDQMMLIASKMINPSCFDSPFTVGESQSDSKIEFDYPVLIEPNGSYRLMLHLEEVKTCRPIGNASKASSANVHFCFETEALLAFMAKLIFHKF